MERFFKGVVATLSFLFIVLFCLSDNINIEKQNRVITEPAIKAAQFEQVPAIIPTERRSDEDKKQFNWKVAR